MPCHLLINNYFIFKSCGCVAYYMPRDASNVSICSPSKTSCVEEAIELVETTAFQPVGPVSECQCKPACTETTFPFSNTQGKLSRAENLKLKKELKNALPQLTDDNFIAENIAIVHIYHEALHFLKRQRGEVSQVLFPRVLL